MKIAFIYAGQGSQTVGMGKSLYENYQCARKVFDNANLDFDLKELCFNGPAEELNQTAFTQPCMTAVAIAATKVLKEEGLFPQMAAGLSLGEYSALYAAGAFDEQTALSITRFRGQAMEDTVKGIKGKMAAVLGLDRSSLQAACKEGECLGIVEIANYNCPGQMVIGGDAAAVDKASKAALTLGAKRVIPLNISGPFHTSMMAPASEKLAAQLKKIKINKLSIPVVFNSTAETLKKGQTIENLLTQQIMSSVYFEDSIKTMEADGITDIIEIGHGKVLSGFVRKTCPSIRVYSVEDYETLIKTISYFKKGMVFR